MPAPKDMNSWPAGGCDPVLEELQTKYIPDLMHSDMPGLLAEPKIGKTAIVSSFGAESAVLLHYVTTILPKIPVIFLETGKHFPETLQYRNVLVERLHLNIKTIAPNNELLVSDDADGHLWKRDPNNCCLIRKTLPLQDALIGYQCWISGRKRFQSNERSTVPLLERDGNMIKINPLALWSKNDVQSYFDNHNLPRHPLSYNDFTSIGCSCCTRAIKPGEDERAGRWAQSPDKSECGIHLSPDGRLVRTLHSQAKKN